MCKKRRIPLTISSVEEQKHNKEKLSVFCDGKYKFSISVNAWIENRLHIGDTITDEQIESIHKTDGPNLAFMQIVNYLGYGEKTEKQVLKKLFEKGYDDFSSTQAIQKAKELNYINDERYTEEYISKIAIPKKMGKQKILTALIQRGISKDIIQDKLSELYDEDEMSDFVYTMAVKKCQQLQEKGNNPRQAQQKVYQFLLSKGFSYETVSHIISLLHDNEFL